MALTAKKILQDHRRGVNFSAEWSRLAKKDLRYSLGDQWDPEVKSKIEGDGRPALTLNIIQANIRLITGYQRDARSSIRAYPEGKEDELTSEIVTRLIKHTIKRTKADMVVSETFETALNARGKSYIQPYIDHTFDLLTGQLKFNVLDGWQVKVDPASTKYDLSDAAYITIKSKLPENEIIDLFPKKRGSIEAAKLMAKDDINTQEDHLRENGEDMASVEEMDGAGLIDEDIEDNRYFVIFYYYKKYVTKYLALDSDRGIAQIFDKETAAKKLLIKAAKADNVVKLSKSGKKTKISEITELTKGQKIIPRKIPEIWCAALMGDQILDDSQAETWPSWKNYPIIPYYPWYSSVAKRVLKSDALAYQGFASSLIDAQDEKNKRRSQALHIANVSPNAGYLIEEDTWVNEEERRKFGSTPGYDLVYKKNKPRPERQHPAGNLSDAHVYFEEKSEQDIKIVSGINADMLSEKDKTTSGRAIALRQQQGLTVLKPIFDNLALTQEMLGKYIISQLSELFTVDKAMQVLGGEFINKNFRQKDTDPVELVKASAANFIQGILDDPDLCNYEIAVGEGLESPTIRYAQYSTLLEMAREGIPIPPNVLLEYADIPEVAKKEILSLAEQGTATPGPGTGKPPARKK